MKDQGDFESRIRGYSLAELKDIRANLDREMHPDRYAQVLSEISRRGCIPSARLSDEEAQKRMEQGIRMGLSDARLSLFALTMVLLLGFAVIQVHHTEQGIGIGTIAISLGSIGVLVALGYGFKFMRMHGTGGGSRESDPASRGAPGRNPGKETDGEE